MNYFYQKRNEENESLQHLPSMENNNRPKTSNSLLMSRSGSMPNLANAYASQPTGILTVYRDKRKKRVITLQSPKDTPEEMNKRELVLKTVPFDTSYQYFNGNTIFPRKLKAKHNELEYYPLNYIWQLPKLSNLLPKPKFVPTTLQSPATPSGKKSPHRGVIARSPSKTLSRSSSSFKNRGKGMKRTSSNLDNQEPSYRKMLLLAEREKVPNVPTTLGSFSSVGHLMTTLQDILDTDHRPLTKPPIPTCHCSLYSQHCRMLPNVGETLEEYLQVEEAKPSEIVVTRTSAQRRSSQLAKNTDSPTSETSTTARPRRASLFSNLTLRRTSLTASPTPTAATSPREVEEPPPEELTTTMTIVKKKPKAAFLTEDILKVLDLQKDLSYYNKYATIIQSIGRRYITRKEFILLKQEHILLRREICRRYVKQKLIAPIFQKVSREYAFYSEQREQRYMEYEDELMHRFNYYTKLQLSLLSMNAMAFAVKQMIGKVSIQLPMIEVLRKKKRKKKRNAIDFIEGSINDDRRDSLTNSVSSLPSFDPSRHRNSLTTASTFPHGHKGNASTMKRKGSVPSATPSAPSTAKAKRRKSVTFDDESIEPSLKEEDDEDISLSIDGGDEESSLNEDDDDSFLNPSKHYHHNNGLSLSDDDDDDDNDDNNSEVIHWYPSYCFSYASLRHQQALIHPKHRYSTEIIARLCRFYPVIPTRPATLPEGMFYDRDVYVLISRYIYQPREQEALAIFLQQRLKKRKEQEEIAQKAIQRLKKRQLSINLANNRLTIRQKNELMQNNLQEASKPLENPLLAILRQQRGGGGGNNNTGEENENPLFKNEWKEEMIFSRLLYPKKTLKHVMNEATFSNFSLPPKQSKRRHVIPSTSSPTSSIEGEDSMASAASFASFYKQQQETIEKDRQFLQITAQQYTMSLRKRRKTLLNPERLFSRLCAMPEVLYNKNTLGRRYSLPDSFTSLYTKQLPVLRQKKYYSQQREDIKRSIEFYEWKKQLLFQCQTNMFDYKKKREEYERNKDSIETKTTKTSKTSVKKSNKSPKRLNKDSGKTITTIDSDSITKDDESSFVSAGSKKPSLSEGEQQQQQTKKKKLPDEVMQSYTTMYKSVTSLFQSSVLTPALPKEMNELLRNHSRRRTIGEPERLLTQLNSIMDIREFYHVNIMNIDKDFNIKRRRRSFDYTEERDIEMGILPQLDLSFEDDTEIILMHRLQRQSVEMDRRILKSGYLYDPEKEKEEEEEKAREAAEKEKEGGNNGQGVEEEKKMMSSGSSTQPSLSRPGTSQRPSIVQKPRKASVQPKNLSRTKKAAENNKKGGGDNESLTIYSGEGDDNSSFAYSSIPNTTRSAMSTTTTEYGGRGVKGRVGGGVGVDVWQEHYTEDGLTYYYQPQTERSSWDRPEGESVQIQVMYLDESTGQQYWLNHSTGETYWLDGRVKE